MASYLKDLDKKDLFSIIEKYGEPKRRHFSADFLDFECELVRQSVSKGRNHDITCFIRDGSEYVVIQKHAYANSGIFRAPSGGANFGESIEVAAKREMQEETGLEIRLLRFVLDLTLDVKCSEGVIPWRSLVFLAEPVGGEMIPQDTFEIYEVRRMSKEALLNDIEERMIESGWGGFRYRAYLQRTFFELMDEMGLES